MQIVILAQPPDREEGAGGKLLVFGKARIHSITFMRSTIEWHGSRQYLIYISPWAVRAIKQASSPGRQARQTSGLMS
ncbi:hypothetical protein FHX15_001819 [Rhizobium sp. BK650]|uniref:hypothetical protein n=1 Tax=Rhizobium sp. BK650 TaxID=2586990 RepID=UPI0016167373|nr:hypothetical protein [Rhizobium sp. BK650]MBB3656591.1 hypothetical protein [Rhizobium sp. BK650]